VKPRAAEFQFLTSSKGSVGMNGDAAVVGIGAKAGVKKFAASVIGTVTVKTKNKSKLLNLLSPVYNIKM
jgi:hypothetical protein